MIAPPSGSCREKSHDLPMVMHWLMRTSMFCITSAMGGSFRLITSFAHAIRSVTPMWCLASSENDVTTLRGTSYSNKADVEAKRYLE